MTSQQTLRTTVILSFLIGVGIFISDLYTPSLPMISLALHTTSSLVKLSISSYLLGYAIPQLFFGPLSDKFGRKPVVLVGLGLAVLGSVVCLFAHSVTELILGRFIQGCGAAGSLAIGRVIAFDLFSGKKLAQVGSYMGLIFSLMPAIAPVVGGYMQFHFGWHGSFVLMVILTFIMFMVITLFLHETIKVKTPHALKLSHAMSSFTRLLKSPHFMAYTLCSGMGMSAMMVYASMGPYLLQNTLHLSPVIYGWISLVILAGYIIGKYINTLLINKLGVKRMVILGIILMNLAGVMMIALALVLKINIYIIAAPIIVYLIGCGTIMPNAMVGAFTGFKEIAGYTAALYGFLQISCTVIATSITAHLQELTQLPFAMSLTALAVIAALGFFTLIYKSTSGDKNA